MPKATYLQLQHCCASQTGASVSLCRGPYLHTWTMDRAAIRSTGLWYNGLHPCNLCNYDSFSNSEMDSWVRLIGSPIADCFPPKSLVDHRLGAGRVKSAGQRRCFNHWALPPLMLCYAVYSRPMFVVLRVYCVKILFECFFHCYPAILVI